MFSVLWKREVRSQPVQSERERTQLFWIRTLVCTLCALVCITALSFSLWWVEPSVSDAVMPAEKKDVPKKDGSEYDSRAAEELLRVYDERMAEMAR